MILISKGLKISWKSSTMSLFVVSDMFIEESIVSSERDNVILTSMVFGVSRCITDNNQAFYYHSFFKISLWWRQYQRLYNINDINKMIDS